MSKIEKNNKPTIEKKSKTNSFATNFGGDALQLDAELQEELASRGLVGRYVNIKKMQENGGWHSSGWRLYKRQKPSEFESLLGSSSDGLVRRGADLALAVKTKEEVADQREYLAAKREEYKGAHTSRARKRQLEDFLQNSSDAKKYLKVQEDTDDDN